MSTRKNIVIAAGYAAVLIVGMVIGPKFANENSNSKNGSFLPFGLGDRSEKIDRILKTIDQNYVDSVAIDTIKDKAIAEIISQLDPHSAYLSPADARLLSEDLEGNFYGIGIEYYFLNDTILVTAVTQNGPASNAGLLRGDKILKINGHAAAGETLSSRTVVEQIRGKSGTTVRLTIKRATDLKTIAVVRDKITISSIDAAYMLNSKTGYVKISRFGDQTDEDFVASLQKLKKTGLQNLILDLRQNGGGYLNSATALADQFLGKQQLIVFTKGVHEPRTNYFATELGGFEQGKLVVLIDENTASASEIVAGAVQDLDRGTIIGRRSFGKGLVQEQFDFGDGSALNLTVARYYTPSGRSIQKSYKNGNESYYQELSRRTENGEMSTAGKQTNGVSKEIQKTYLTSSGKVVYGGGGITPDIYVPIDTSGQTPYYYQLSAKGVLNDFVFKKLALTGPNYNTLTQLIKNFKLSDANFRELNDMAARQQIAGTENQADISKRLIESDLKALLARYFFGDEGFYKVLNADDRVIARSMEVLK